MTLRWRVLGWFASIILIEIWIMVAWQVASYR